MPIKESSDELNPPPDATESALVPRTAKDYLALAIATCGVGYLPLAPGTWGSLVGVVLYFYLKEMFLKIYLFAAENLWFTKDAFEGMENRLLSLFTCFLLLVIIGISLVGTWAASRTEKLSRRKDPGIVVIDEVVGQLVTFIFLPSFFMGGHHVQIPFVLVEGFVLFRFFDIVKPYPARRLEGLPGGLGIMADDVVAGVYAAVALTVIFAGSSISGILPR
ncbi:MAG: phosphatidylglycerophosphatase A family protein [Pyrinomonadaceae bacterium]